MAFLFDLDGTLVDSVYQHVRAWHLALREQGIDLSVWRIHRKIGMSGGLFTHQLLRELGREIDEAGIRRLRDRHAEIYLSIAEEVVPLPGSVQLLHSLAELELPWAIATSGLMRTAGANLRALGVDPDKATVVTRDQVRYAKPDPDLFVEAARRVGSPIVGSYVIGDSIWDMLAAARCGALGIGLLSGGYGADELERAGALRVYDDPADMLAHIDELAPRTRD
ncbi:HAD family hydrolase [Sphingomonas sp.]|uniref:HAD family hydrolase n=1 Tax=Sphingomonas sp. TaxID=28214 RepID=UPI0025D37610|nr:HAD family hydrolase [Sphingomonas sp.]